MTICDKCKDFGLRFERQYSPEEWLEGKATSRVWIVGLNPKGNSKLIDERNKEALSCYFSDNEKMVHPYFKDFKTVSPKLYFMLGQENGAAHTDIVKCFSENFPPNKDQRKAKEIIQNCKGYLEKQITALKPEIIICNGSPVSQLIKEIIKPVNTKDTSYEGNFKGNKIIVILSGFVGRIDNYAKRRLGVEIEKYLDSSQKIESTT